MNGEIGRNGVLFIQRGIELKVMNCFNDSDVWCRDTCSLFGEPYKVEMTDKTALKLCHAHHVFDEFTDKRGE